MIFKLVLGTVAAVAVGFLWYSDSLFGKPWRKLVGLSTKDLKAAQKKMAPMYSLMIVFSLIYTYSIGMFLDVSGTTSLIPALTMVTQLWFGFVATTIGIGYIFNQKPATLWAIDSFHFLFAMLAATTTIILL